MTGFDEEELWEITLIGGKKLSDNAAGMAIHEAMLIIETVGTTGIEHKHQQAAEWLTKYYPGRQ